MKDFNRKARLVVRGHMTHISFVITYSSVITRETVQIAFNMAAFHDLKVKAAHVLNAYVMAPNRKMM